MVYFFVTAQEGILNWVFLFSFLFNPNHSHLASKRFPSYLGGLINLDLGLDIAQILDAIPDIHSRDVSLLSVLNQGKLMCLANV